MNKVLLVFAHPREDSLTAQVAGEFASRLSLKGKKVEIANLMAEGFNPVLQQDDEPDWNDPKKTYSVEVQAEMDRIRRNEAMVMIFPVWWWSMPAVLKGWIDRVWNNGFAYGGDDSENGFPHERVWMVGVAGSDQATFLKRDYSEAMRIQLEDGILGYCGVKDRKLTLFYGANDGPEECERILHQARELAEKF
jgi:NAD(P)H dehydrogenase (quinone)